MSQTRKRASLALTMLLAVVAGGFFAGTRDEWPREAGYVSRAAAPTTGIEARGYTELREQAMSPNAEIYSGARATLIGLLPSVTDEVPPRGPMSRGEALARRQRVRAYDGAPPTIPHPIDTRAEPNCLVCHEHGARIGELSAPAMSHPVFPGCLQCHVEGPVGSPLRRGDTPFGESRFEPLQQGGQGSRAWGGAPPVVPHRGFMRERCNSCHGVAGALGIRTPHPDRQSCQQCHVLDERLDQGSFFAALRSPGGPP